MNLLALLAEEGTPIEPVYPYVIMQSPNSFSLSATKRWALMEYSLDDGATWTSWNGAAISGTKICLRGKGNTRLGAQDSTTPWKISGTDVSLIGNAENLFDYSLVASGIHPTLAEDALCGLFSGCTAIISGWDILSASIPNNGLLGMYINCTNLKKAGKIGATYVGERGCGQMFSGCTSLEIAPSIKVTSLGLYPFMAMFSGCTSLKTIPALYPTYVPMLGYVSMFMNCSSLKMSTTQTAECPNPWKMPWTGSGSGGDTNWNYNMFNGTGGTFTGNPSMNVTYYTNATVVL